MMAKGKRSCSFGVSAVAMKVSYVREQFRARGLRAERVEVDNGATVVRCWAPGGEPERGVWSAGVADRPAVLFLHDFAADGSLTWERQVGAFAKEFNCYVPDLVFFGASETQRGERSEAFQAECMVKMLHALEVYNEVTVVGAGYGGIVAFWMAHLYPKLVTRVVFVAAGTHMTPGSQKPLLAQFEYDHIAELLLPTTAKGLRNFASVATHKRVHRLPKFICNEFLDAFVDEHRHEKVELLSKMVCGKVGAPLPQLTQMSRGYGITGGTNRHFIHAGVLLSHSERNLIIWGAKDQITGLDLALKLKVHLGTATDLVVMNKCGHFPQIENPASFNRILSNFLKTST